MAIFQKKSVATIMASFTKTINELQGYAENMHQEAQRHEETIRQATEDQNTCRKEKASAINIASKLSQILEG